MENQLSVHFHSKDGDERRYSMWKWLDGYWGQDASFSGRDDFGLYGEITFPANRFMTPVNLLVKTDDWSKQTNDYKVRRFVGDAPNEIWLVEGDGQVYYSKQAALTSPYLKNPDQTAFDMAVHIQDFDRRWGFQGWLGYRYDKSETRFRLWSPLAHRVQLVLYAGGEEQVRVYDMKRGEDVHFSDHRKNTRGVWSLAIKGDLDTASYIYRVYHEEDFYQETRDPYSIALTLDNQRSLIAAPESLIPENFEAEHGRDAGWRVKNPCSAVIAELHLRDLTGSVSSGVDAHLRGTFLGACQPNTRNAAGDATAFDYIKQMGYSYVQLQPVFDHHKTYDKDGKLNYNWGYDPENYNVPDRQFASDQENPLAPILELKQMIHAYHQAGIGVVMDVVYNHTYSSFYSPLQLSVPNYYYRMNYDGSFQDGSGCGNETASEKEMYRKYMIDSLTYWAREFGIDGFRFDLMGLHDVDTMNAIRSAMDRIDPRILIYGEGWDMGSGLPGQYKAMKANAHFMPRIAFFNDNERDAVKGSEVFDQIKRGFVSGQGQEEEIAKSLLGSLAYVSYVAPNQVLNYIEAHDNYNLNDLLTILHPGEPEEELEKRVYLANALNLLMQGICFMQLGQEFQRTKLVATGPRGEYTDADYARARNSYNAPDAVNCIDWNQVTRKSDLIAAIRDLIRRKKTAPEFSCKSYEEIGNQMEIKSSQTGSGLVILESIGVSKKHYCFDSRKKTLEIS